MGSPASDRVKDHPMQHLRSEGLSVEVQHAIGARSAAGLATFGRVDNIVATIPGTEPTGTVLDAGCPDGLVSNR
jgi:hypothetical protein